MTYDEYVEIYDDFGNLESQRTLTNIKEDDALYWQQLANQQNVTIFTEKFNWR